MRYYEKYFSINDIEKIFDEYCKEFKIDELDSIERFRVTREFKNASFLHSSKNGVISKLRTFIEFHHPIIFKIIDQKRKCEILEIYLMDNCWSYNRLDWNKGLPL